MTTPNRAPKRASLPERYREMCLHKLEQARDELDKGDLSQASEKIWGAAAEILKAVDQQRGWNHHAHNYLQHIAFYVAHKLTRNDLHIIFTALEALHTNYYEHQYFRDVIEVRLEYARIFVEALSDILDNPDLELLPDSPEQEVRLRALTRRTQHSLGAHFGAEGVADLPPVRPNS